MGQYDDGPCAPGAHNWLSAKILGYEDELHCSWCGSWKYPGDDDPDVMDDVREPYMDAAALRLEAELDDIAMHEEYEERFNDRDEYTWQRDWDL